MLAGADPLGLERFEDPRLEAAYQIAVTSAMHDFLAREIAVNPFAGGSALIATVFDEHSACPACHCPLAAVFSNGSRLCSNCGTMLRWGCR